ncbi:MAG TPA: hypothetical protein VFE34_16460 [Dongiaceae bacterium]|jgi:hypothetical protein|nr:hypothetical protein [Dongiaceae bacterium]
MNSMHSPAIVEHQSRSGLGQIARQFLAGWRGLIALAAVVLAAGLALNWGWLVAAGVAPVLISVLPCVAMCALGLCMNKMTGRKCSTEQSDSIEARSEIGSVPPALPGGRESDPSRGQ